MTPSIKFKKLDPLAQIPKRGREGDAGLDLYALVIGPRPTLSYGEVLAVSTGLAVEIPPGYVGLVCPRSGLAASFGVTVANAPGVIDANFRGELKVLLTKVKPGVHTVGHWDRIAQLVVVPVAELPVEEAAELTETNRGAAGFGSSGR